MSAMSTQTRTTNPSAWAGMGPASTPRGLLVIPPSIAVLAQTNADVREFVCTASSTVESLATMLEQFKVQLDEAREDTETYEIKLARADQTIHDLEVDLYIAKMNRPHKLFKRIGFFSGKKSHFDGWKAAFNSVYKKSNISEEEALDEILFLLQGKIRSWWSYASVGVRSVDEAMDILGERYARKASDASMMQRLHQASQREGQPVTELFNWMTDIFFDLETPIPELKQVHFMYHALDKSIKKRLALRDYTTYRQLWKAALEQENILADCRVPQWPPSPF